MMLAQQLYEAGYISYMRTDSVNLSQDSLATAKTFIDSNYGKIIPWTNRADSKTKPRGRKEALEAVRYDGSVKNAGLNERPG